MVAQLPLLVIKDGKLQADPPGQTIIKDKTTGKPIIIIDPNNEFRRAELPQNVVLLTKTELVVEQAGGMSRTVPLSQLGDRTITHESAMKFLKLLTKIVPPVAFLFIFVASFIFRLLLVLLYGAIGVLIAGGAKANLDYSALVRIAVIAITPVVIFQSVLELANVNLPIYASWLLGFSIAMWYLFFGVKANADLPPAAAESPAS